jgi:hypothetical protein
LLLALLVLRVHFYFLAAGLDFLVVERHCHRELLDPQLLLVHQDAPA